MILTHTDIIAAKENVVILEHRNSMLERKQEVNFYKKNEMIERSVFSLRNFIIVVLITCVFLSLYTVNINKNLFLLDKKNDNLSTRFDEITTLNESVNASAKDSSRSVEYASIRQRLMYLEQSLEVKRSIIFFAEEYNNKRIFYSYKMVSDIYSSVLPGMNIIDVTARQGGYQISLNGVVNKTLLATQFLLAMKNNQYYKNVRFGLLSLTKIEPTEKYQFSLMDQSSSKRRLGHRER